MQVFTKRFHPGIEAIVTTENGHIGRAICTAGISIGSHEVKFQYDGGRKSL
jgi:enolase